MAPMEGIPVASSALINALSPLPLQLRSARSLPRKKRGRIMPKRMPAYRFSATFPTPHRRKSARFGARVGADAPTKKPR